MTGSADDSNTPKPADSQLPRALAEYADRLLLGTGLDAADALLIASGDLEPPAELSALASALQAGWTAEVSS
jgi:hypothetical protein